MAPCCLTTSSVLPLKLSLLSALPLSTALLKTSLMTAWYPVWSYQVNPRDMSVPTRDITIIFIAGTADRYSISRNAWRVALGIWRRGAFR